MERIFKIKTKTRPAQHNQYPSERRYSSSLVLGLSVVFLHLSLCSVLMGALIIYKTTVLRNIQEENNSSFERLNEKVETDFRHNNDKTYLHYYINVPVLESVGCFLMAFGQVLATVMGVLAWKRWYIDTNITFFFLTCILSTLTSGISLLISCLTSFVIKFDRYEDYSESSKDLFPISLPLQVNIVVLSVGSAMWSFLSSKISYSGMRNKYPEEATVSKNEIRDVCQTKPTTHVSTIPVEVFNTFAMLNYMPKKGLEDLPGAESVAEYQQRVNFLNSSEKSKANDTLPHEGKHNPG
ncbi:uncharacterized protein LOC115891439 [Sitophilus oryzae]|uniref:Uncharacterized protein LOC115891439 n=1 Tax=Sitophilus oryzae TaxID=7048 RepID=A0A6J2YX28_SITOR|nr:uncharacterized protein LOC115891439 [Sitophilus oryzae]